MVTIYAFSIENFKRSKYEVDALMDMAKVKLSQLAQHGDLLERYGASIRILGQRDLVKQDVLDAIDDAVALTSKHKRYVSRCREIEGALLTVSQRHPERLLPIHISG